MVNKFCTYLSKKMQREMPEIDDERAEIIEYGLELIIGEIPKIILLFVIAIILKIGWLVLFSYIILLPYKISSGGFHCKTHVGCFITTCVMYIGTAFLSKYFFFEPVYIKYIVSVLVLVFGLIMITLYAPADTENVPILSIKERKKKKKLSYIFLIANIVIGIVLPISEFSNTVILGTLIHTCTITKLAYKITKNKYGYQSNN